MEGEKGGATFRASASVAVEVDAVKLRAYARAQAGPIDPAMLVHNAGAKAVTTWYDTLSVANFEALPLVFKEHVDDHGLLLSFFLDDQGSLSGVNYGFNILAILSDSAADPPEPFVNATLFSRTHERRDGVIVVDRQSGHVPLRLRYSSVESIDRAEIEVYMSLDVFANSYAVPQSQSGPSEADFSHTFSLLPIIVSDAAGNFIPGSESLQFVGSSGAAYAVRAVPEPSTQAIVICAALLGLGRARKRRKSDARWVRRSDDCET
jgi:hypothetical protein